MFVSLLSIFYASAFYLWLLFYLFCDVLEYVVLAVDGLSTELCRSIYQPCALLVDGILIRNPLLGSCLKSVLSLLLVVVRYALQLYAEVIVGT